MTYEEVLTLEFITKLEETPASIEYRNRAEEFLLYGNYENNGYRAFNHIIFGDIKLSVQACSGHYCTPRKTFTDLTKYKEMEFAVIKERDLVNVKKVIGDNNLAVRLNQFYDGSVYCYVPVELIEELYQQLTQQERSDVKT